MFRSRERRKNREKKNRSDDAVLGELLLALALCVWLLYKFIRPMAIAPFVSIRTQSTFVFMLLVDFNASLLSITVPKNYTFGDDGRHFFFSLSRSACPLDANFVVALLLFGGRTLSHSTP